MLLLGDSRSLSLAAESVHCCVTSPAYCREARDRLAKPLQRDLLEASPC